MRATAADVQTIMQLIRLEDTSTETTGIITRHVGAAEIFLRNAGGIKPDTTRRKGSAAPPCLTPPLSARSNRCGWLYRMLRLRKILWTRTILTIRQTLMTQWILTIQWTLTTRLTRKMMRR